MADNFYARYPVTGGGGVTSLNGETGDITLVAGTGISITPAGQNITIASTATPGANRSLSNLTSPTAINQDLLPDTDLGRSLGSASFRWEFLFVDQLRDASNTVILDATGRVLSDGAFAAFDFSTGTRLLRNAAGNTILDLATNIMTSANIMPTITNVSRIGDTSSFYLDVASAAFNAVDPASNFSATISVPSLASNTVFKLPPNNGTAGYVLRTDGAGITTWVAATPTLTSNKETFILSGTNITNQYVDLGHVAQTNSVNMLVQGGAPALEGASYDYSVSYTGGAGGNTRISFLNDLATGGAQALVAGNVLQILYQY